jgi:hypothetical protein
MDVNIFLCAKFLASANVFGWANVFVYFEAPIFLYIFLHSYLVCTNNLIGFAVVMIMYCVFMIIINICLNPLGFDC